MIIYVCSDRGIVYSARAYRIPECTRNAAGTPLVQVFTSLFFFWLLMHFFSCLMVAYIFSLLETDFIFIWWWKNNFHYSCEWVCWKSVSTDAHSQWLHQESISEFVLGHTFIRNHSNSIGLSCSVLSYSDFVLCFQPIPWIPVLRFKILTCQVPGDELKWVRCCTNDDLVAMASQNGMVILCSCENVSYLMLFHLLFIMVLKPYVQDSTRAIDSTFDLGK